MAGSVANACQGELVVVGIERRVKYDGCLCCQTHRLAMLPICRAQMRKCRPGQCQRVQREIELAASLGLVRRRAFVRRPFHASQCFCSWGLVVGSRNHEREKVSASPSRKSCSDRTCRGNGPEEKVTLTIHSTLYSKAAMRLTLRVTVSRVQGLDYLLSQSAFGRRPPNKLSITINQRSMANVKARVDRARVPKMCVCVRSVRLDTLNRSIEKTSILYRNKFKSWEIQISKNTLP